MIVLQVAEGQFRVLKIVRLEIPHDLVKPMPEVVPLDFLQESE